MAASGVANDDLELNASVEAATSVFLTLAQFDPAIWIGDSDGQARLASIPDAVRALRGRRVELTAFMVPLDDVNGRVIEFVAYRRDPAQSMEHSWNPGERVLVRLPTSRATRFVIHPIRVRGILEFDLSADPQPAIWTPYRLQGAVVLPD